MLSKKTITLSTLCLFLISCAVSLYMPTEKDAIKSNTSLDNLKQGRELYINKCGKCHTAFAPSKFTAQQWLPQINRMQKRAKVSDIEKEMINQYLIPKAK